MTSVEKPTPSQLRYISDLHRTFTGLSDATPVLELAETRADASYLIRQIRSSIHIQPGHGIMPYDLWLSGLKNNLKWERQKREAEQ